MYLLSSICRHQVRQTPFVEDVLPFSLYGFGFVAENQASVGICVSFWGSGLISCINLFISIPIPYIFFYCYCSVVQLEGRDGDILRSSFVLQNCLSFFWFLLFFHMKVKIILPSSTKYDVGILIKIALNLQIAFGRIGIFNVNSTDPEYGTSFHL